MKDVNNVIIVILSVVIKSIVIRRNIKLNIIEVLGELSQNVLW